ncbi:hypothetical protein PGT21_003317 [Puccinia graminis f. sp. tritici]|uniref:Uncharacterized protein n=1 Tax=Puccinia graminis f. sp. tritici TaxID=56615 RepID=A0A5B0QED6_PUCGR|nr:hypothetical protein PGT21_003317 [Puccinia graminis f. sp. tritici]
MLGARRVQYDKSIQDGSELVIRTLWDAVMMAFKLLQLSGIVNQSITSSNYTTQTSTGFTIMQLEFQITIIFKSSVIMIGSLKSGPRFILSFFATSSSHFILNPHWALQPPFNVPHPVVLLQQVPPTTPQAIDSTQDPPPTTPQAIDSTKDPPPTTPPPHRFVKGPTHRRLPPPNYIKPKPLIPCSLGYTMDQSGSDPRPIS